MRKNEFEFQKNNKGEWYLDLPKWNGDPGDLQMVEGADQWLDLLSKGDKIVKLQMADKPFDGAEILTLVRLREDNLGGGGIYYLETFLHQKIDLKLWLCDVTAFVFGNIPQKIYFAVKK
jgi:hypothetical protein